MSRRIKILRNAGIGLVGVIAILAMGTVLTVRTQWFRDYVKQRIVSATEESTGGRVEIGSFGFAWSKLHTVVTDLVIHGNEPAGSDPFVRAGRVELDLRLFTSAQRFIELAYLGVDKLQVNVVVLPDGRTNVPTPKLKSTGDQTALETVVDLAVGRFELTNSLVKFHSQQQELDVKAEHLRAQLWYRMLERGYRGSISLQPIYVVSGRKTPVRFIVTIPVSLARDRIAIENAKVSTEASEIVFNGSMENLRNPKSAARINGHVALADLKNLMDIPAGVNTRGLPPAIELSANVALTANTIQLTGLRLTAFGGEIAGSASLENMARYKVNGTVRQLDLGAMARALGQKELPYAGSASGPIAVEGDLKTAGTKSVSANARLVIAPGGKGIPVSGHLNANYDGQTNGLSLHDSYLALPHTRLTLSGSLANRLDFALSSRDLNDLFAPMAGARPPITLTAGAGTFTGAVTGRLESINVAGHLALDPFTMAGRQFDSLAADVSVSRSAAAIANGRVTRSAMLAQFAGTIGLDDWRPTPNQRLAGDASMHNGDLADILAMAGQPNTNSSGALSIEAHVAGTLGNPNGSANVAVLSGAVQGEPFDRIEAQVKMQDRWIAIPAAYAIAGRARIDLTGEFQHPRDSLTKGTLHVHAQTNQVELAQLRNLQKRWPQTDGQIQGQADLTGELAETKSAETEFRLTNVNGEGVARNIRFEGETYGDFTARARTMGQTVSYSVVSDFAGSNIRANGNTQLAPGYPTNAEATIGKLPIERVLILAKRTDIPVKGIASGTAHMTGTVEKPEGSLDLDITSAVIYDEPIDRVRVRATYLAQSVDVPQLEITSGPSRLALTAHYDHPVGNLQAGNLQFKLNSSRIDLATIRTLQRTRPGLGGVVEVTAAGAATVNDAQPRVSIQDLNANILATAITARGKSVGDFKFAANTATGGQLDFTLNSHLAGGAIQGHGSAELRGEYPVNAELAFSNITWSGLRGLVGPASSENPDFDAVTDGQITVAGPILKTDQLNGSLQFTQLRVNTIPNRGVAAKSIVIQNQGPIAASMQGGVATITSFHLAGPDIDIRTTGTVSLRDQAVNMSVSATTNLRLLQSLDRDISSSGSVAVAATIRGTTSAPLVNGRLELKSATMNHAALPNGISNANGVVMFNGNSATFRNMTAESGGGTLTMGGFATITDVLRVGLRVSASNVRIRLQQGVSVVADASISVAGTTEGSVASGTVTIQQVNYNPRSDFGALLSSQAPPIQSPATPSPLLDSIRLEIRVRTSDAMAVQASLAQNLQSDADLRIRGTASHPGVLGRMSITEGDIVFFGSTYTVSNGTISFYNPTRIEPILNISLQTKAKGVDVTLTVTGPIDDMKLSYTSDPPLQFQEIVSLLASGKAPTSDPTLLANQPSTPPQSFQQMGESALVGKALADPVSSRLQRVFGVSQLKVDPTFTSGSELPQARLTLQQQISTNITFTYITALDDPNTQIIRAEWAFNQQWSAIATRDENGIVSINFFYKKQFR